SGFRGDLACCERRASGSQGRQGQTLLPHFGGGRGCEVLHLWEGEKARVTQELSKVLKKSKERKKRKNWPDRLYWTDRTSWRRNRRHWANWPLLHRTDRPHRTNGFTWDRRNRTSRTYWSSGSRYNWNFLSLWSRSHRAGRSHWSLLSSFWGKNCSHNSGWWRRRRWTRT